MSLKTSKSYHLPSSYVYTSPPSCILYYSNPTQTYQSPISVNNSFVPSDEQLQLQHTGKTSLYTKSRRNHPNDATKQLYQSIDSSGIIPTTSDDSKVINIHRSHSQRHANHQQVVKEKSFQNSSSMSQCSETVPDRQRSELDTFIDDYCRILKDQSATISNEELTHLLNKLTSILKRFDNIEQQQQRLSIVIDILNALIWIRPSVLIATSQNDFFSILQTTFIHVIRQWHRLSSLQNNEFLMFRIMTKLIQELITATDDVKLIPSWLVDSTLLEAISNCLTNIVTSKNFLQKNNKTQFKYFIHLIDAYILYQLLNDQNHSHKDALVQLLNPILHCLTSPQFIQILANVPIDAKSMTTIEKLFLVKCPAFLTSYNGSRLEQTMKSFLTTMLPQYAQLLNQLVLSAHNWKRSMIRSVHHLLQMINHGSNQFQTNGKLVSNHLSLIDNVLKLVNEPILYNNLRETLSNPETALMNTAISFLVNMIGEPSILAHIKQSQVAGVFLRLTTCPYEPLVFNVYALLAYTTHEEDIKAMHSPGRLLATVIKSLKVALNGKLDKKTQIEQLLETLKGLVQHDQIKDEIIKRNALPFLLECTKKLINRALVLIFDIIWSLTFREEIARTLRADSELLYRIQTISKDNSNEPLKKAADGLIWKLIQESASLEKVAKQEEEQEAELDEKITTAQIVIGANGTEQIVRTTRRGSMTPSERSYQYDIMISYCHSDKELAYKIHKFLIDEGFKVWIDLDNMYGPAMSAMAEAVENSEFVIMCMSDAYKQSTYCQAEAEYAFKCKRRLIPLVMRQGYKPDGWLGFMIGSRMYVDFGRFDFGTACEKLMTEISLQRKQIMPTIFINPLEHENPIDTRPRAFQLGERNRKPSVARPAEKTLVKKNVISSVFKARQEKLNFFRKPINQWTESDVSDFLLAHRLNQLTSLCEVMNGRGLIQLYKICTSHRLRAYSVLKDELKSKDRTILSLGVYSQFLSATEEAIKSLSIPPPPPSKNNHPKTATTMPFIPAPNLDASYDFSITTNASPLDTLKMVECFGSQLQLLDSLRRRVSSVF